MLIFMITLHLHTPRAPACSQRREATFWKCTRIRNAHFQIIVRNTSYDMELYLSKYIPSLRGCNNIQKEHRVRSVRNIRDAPQDVDHVFSVNGMRMAHESAQECEKYRSDRSGACNSSRIRQSRTHKNIETV